MQLPLYQVDAFASAPFQGNPAAVVPLRAWLPGDILQAIAEENHLSETAFLVRAEDDGAYDLRWFTPAAEVDLCGHATLASAHIVRRFLDPGAREMSFQTRSGRLVVHAEGDRLRMDLPAHRAEPAEAPAALAKALGHDIVHFGRAAYDMAVLGTAAEVAALRPDMRALAAHGAPLIVTAKAAEGSGLDFVSRFFAPTLGVPEDPVTGSAHCTLAPYWSETLGLEELRAAQLSARGGQLHCRVQADRVHVTGQAVLVIEGTLHLPD